MAESVGRGFDEAEFRARLYRAQTRMADRGLAALLLTTEPEIRYFTGFLTRFWESPTRPWFLLVPAAADPVAVIPAIGADLMRKSWLNDIRTWCAPDLEDDGISLLAATIREIIGANGKIGLPMGHETHLRMPLGDFFALQKAVSPLRFESDGGIMRELRLVKSDVEIAKIRNACAIAGRAFAAVPDFVRPGMKLSEVFRHFQMRCLEEGADWVAYLAGGAGPGGYGDVISPADDRPLTAGDILMLDTGAVFDGYFCDFDRNYAIGRPDPRTSSAHDKLIDATAAGMDAARPGASASDLFHVMDRILTGGRGGMDAGRLGHGLGMSLTEWPSLIPDDHTELKAGMVLTLEPSISTTDGRIMVHEENIVIRDKATEYLTQPAADSLPVIGL